MILLDDRPIASGLTRHPLPRPLLRNRVAAEYLSLRSPDAIPRRITLSVPGQASWERPWFVEYVEAQLNALLQLAEGWDARRGQPVELAAVRGSVAVLAALMDETSAPPQVFPLSDGGLQIEWHIGGNDIEIEVDCDGEVHVLATTTSGETIAEGVVDADAGPALLASVRDFLRRLSMRLGTIR